MTEEEKRQKAREILEKYGYAEIEIKEILKRIFDKRAAVNGQQ